MKDEEIKSGIYRDKKGMYMKINKKDKASLRPEYYDIRYKMKGSKVGVVKTSVLARSREEVAEHLRDQGYTLVSVKKSKHKINFSF